MPPNSTAASTKSKNTNRKRADDDSAYVGSSGPSRKRAAAERVEGPERAKRKRVETASLLSSNFVPLSTQAMMKRDNEPRPQYMDFAALPASALYNYITTWDLVPGFHISDNSTETPPLPGPLLSLLNSRGASPDGTSAAVTPANRPRREMKEMGKRRSTRMEEEMRDKVAVMADVDGAHQTLAMIAERHFLARPAPNEPEVIRNFFLAVDRGRG